MKKLVCRKYLNHATTLGQLGVYVGHLFRAHGDDRPPISNLLKLTASAAPFLSYKRSHRAVAELADQFVENYDMEG